MKSKNQIPLEEFDLYEDDPFEDDLSSPMELMFQEASSALDEDTQPECDEEADLAKVPIRKIEELANVFFGMRRAGILADRAPLLKRVWYDFANECPHLTFTLRYPFPEAGLSEALLGEVRGDVEELGDMLAPLFGKQIAISFEMC